MMKAGLIEEMMNDALDSALDTEEMEEETEEQIQRVLAEIVGETSAALPQAQVGFDVEEIHAVACREGVSKSFSLTCLQKNKVPARGKQQESQEEPDEIEEGSEMAEMRRRLEAIRS
jgi:hypothetical protein